LPEVEAEYERLKNDRSSINIVDLGAGSKAMKGEKRIVADIAKYSVMPLKYRILLRKLVSYFNVKKVLELGTSLGITSLYLTYGNRSELVTVEGDKSIAAIAAANFDKFKEKASIRLVNASFEDFIDFENTFPFDLVLVDGNHTYEATVKYFETISKKNIQDNMIWIFDDIYWSEGMTKAWNQIISQPQISLSLDLCRLGIAFTNPGLSKQHFVIRY
jgi:predicted O-methyltransferase YrrM